MSDGILFGDTMIPFSLVIWVFPGLCIGCWTGSIGPVSMRMFDHICSICMARKSPCPQWAPTGHVSVGHRWDHVAMDILHMSVTTPKGNQYVLVMVDCFSRWTEACPLPNKMALAVADAFFQLIVCRFGMRLRIRLRITRPVMGWWSGLTGHYSLC